MGLAKQLFMPIPVKTMPITIPVPAPVIRKLPLDKNQYYQAVHPKKYIILHHTAGGSVAGAVAGWAATPEHIATPYLIERTGDIYECFSPEFWAYHLGVKGNTAIEKASIGIEIVNYGQLTLKNGKYYTYTNRELPASDVTAIEWRGFKYFQKYTVEQIAALKSLLPYLIDRFKITLQADRSKFYEYQNPATLPPGIWSHTTVRKDKVDIFPQAELVELISKL